MVVSIKMQQLRESLKQNHGRNIFAATNMFEKSSTEEGFWVRTKNDFLISNKRFEE